MSAPSEAELFALAERALAHAGEEAQVTAWWERSLSAHPFACLTEEVLRVEVMCVRAGSVGRVSTGDVDEEGLARAARGAADLANAREARDPWALPEPGTGRAHTGWDPSLLRLDPAEVAEGAGPGTAWAGAAARTAIISTRGVRAYEQRSHVRRTAFGAELAAVRAAEVADPAPYGDWREDPQPEPVEPGEYAVVLGPAAVAAALDPLRSLLADAVAPGRRAAAAAVNLSDSPRFAGTLPRSYDEHGSPLAPAPLIQDGVAAASIPSRRLDHLVLVGGGASDANELAAPIDDGLFIPVLHVLAAHTPLLAVAAPVRIRGGEISGGGVPGVRVVLDPLALLGAVQALTSSQATIPTRDRSARTAGATVCPAARFGGGVRVL